MIETLISGGVTGLLGSIASNVLGYFKSKQEHKQQMERDELQARIANAEHRQALEQIKTEAEYRQAELQINAERDIDVAELAALKASYESDVAYAGDNKLMLVAEFVKKLTRPVLTFLLVFVTTGIYFGSADPVLQDVIARSVVALTSTVVSWWFADRQIAKHVAQKVLA